LPDTFFESTKGVAGEDKIKNHQEAREKGNAQEQSPGACPSRESQNQKAY